MSLPTRCIAAVCLLLAATPAFAAEKRVHKIDSLIATLKGRELQLQASGAVETGGWKNARFKLVHDDGHLVTVEFVALPPPVGMTVIEGLVPVSATADVKVRPGVVSVRAIADINEITTQVLH